MIYLQPDHMVSKKSFTLLVALAEQDRFSHLSQ